MKIFAGTAHPKLAQEVATRVGESLGKTERRIFPNGEQKPLVLDPVKDEVVFIIQPLTEPADENIIQLALLADAFKRRGARRVVAVTPWLAYSPQDKIFLPGGASIFRRGGQNH